LHSVKISTGDDVGQDQYFEPDVELMARTDLEAMQEERILELVPYVYERSGLVRQTWDAARVHPRDIRSLEDFRERVPFTSKDQIRGYRDTQADPFGGLLCIERRDLTDIVTTSGTTGDATLLPERWDGPSTLSADNARNWWGMGIRPGDYGFATWTFRTPSFYEALQMCGAAPIMFDPITDSWEDVIERTVRYEVALLWLGAADVVPLNRLADRYDLRKMFASLKAVKYAGAPLGAAMHRKMIDEWGVNVFIGTSTGDAGSSFECTAHDGCHIWEDNVFAEHIDVESDRQAAPGTIGELVVTSLDNPAAPLVRYRSDDLVYFSTEPCSCGRTHARQWPVGRKGEEVVVDGRTVVPSEIWAALETLPETEDGIFQLIRPAREMDTLRIRVGFDTDRVRRPAELSERVRAAVTARTGIDPDLELVADTVILGSGPNHKIIRVVKA
jgi:phenylacetate-CoA ligase